MSRRNIAWAIVPIALVVVARNMRYLSPDSWLGVLTQSWEGRLLVDVIGMSLAVAVYAAWMLFRTRKRSRRTTPSDSR